MPLGVVVALVGLGVGLGLIGLGFYFLWKKRPYSRLLRQARAEGREIYQGWRRGEVWEVLVSVGTSSEKHWVEATDLGRWMFRRAMGNFYEKEKVKALAIEAETAEALGESLAYEWVVRPNRRVMEMEQKAREDFSSSRREVLSLVKTLLSPLVAMRERTAG
jgi:hypothetical protein